MALGWIRTLMGGAALAVAPLHAQPSLIVGRVFDSLRMKPLARVTVELAGTPFTVLTDADGQYRLTTEVKGKRTIRFSEPRLDRLVGAISSEVELTPGSEIRLDVSIPPTPPGPAVVCGLGPGESAAGGAALGVVRDSVTGLPISGAKVTAYWRATPPDSGHRGLQGTTGEDGGYLLCRLPTDRPVTLMAQAPAREVAVIAPRLSDSRILDVDLMAQLPEDRAGVGRVRGKVVDSSTGGPLAGADVMIVEHGLHATTNSDGEFALADVAPGKLALVVRHIGYRPEFVQADVDAGGTATVAPRLRPAPFRLEDLEIRAPDIDYRGFVERQKLGVGKYWDAEEIRRFDGGSMTAMLNQKAMFAESRTGVLLNRSRSRNCVIPVVMNGVLWTDGAAANLRPEQFDAVEYYSGPAQVPMEFQSMHLRARGFGCGLLVVWQRGIK